MANNPYKERVCPYKMEAFIRSGVIDASITVPAGNCLARYLCTGPKCMAWTEFGGQKMANCMRMK